MIANLLSAGDVGRVSDTVARLQDLGVGPVALTGGIAIAWHLARASGRSRFRPLNDLDLVVEATGVDHARIAERFQLSKVNPAARPGRLLVQAVDPATALRIDIFGPFGRQFDRSRPVRFGTLRLWLVSAADLAARLTALVMDLELGETVPRKHARDLAARDPSVDTDEAQAAWIDHRRPRHPATFAEARRAAASLARSQGHLLVTAPPLTAAAVLLEAEAAALAGPNAGPPQVA